MHKIFTGEFSFVSYSELVCIFEKIVAKRYNSVFPWKKISLDKYGVVCQFRLLLDCYTRPAWGKRHGLQLPGIMLLWLIGLNIGGDCYICNGSWAHITGVNLHFSGPITVSLQTHNGRQFACHRGCARRLWNSLIHCHLHICYLIPTDLTDTMDISGWILCLTAG